MEGIPRLPREMDGHRKIVGGDGCPLGFVTQSKVADQWKEMDAEKAEFMAPRAACGYFACINALAISQMKLPGAIESAEDLKRWQEGFDWLASIKNVRRAIAAFMRDLWRDRGEYVKQHPEEFATKDSVREYLSNWVANYEISDRLQQFVARTTSIRARSTEEPDGIPSGGSEAGGPARVLPERLKLYFLRHIERDEVSEEEARREPEMAPFRRLRCFVEGPGEDYADNSRRSGPKSGSTAAVGTVGTLVGPPLSAPIPRESAAASEEAAGAGGSNCSGECDKGGEARGPTHAWPQADLLHGLQLFSSGPQDLTELSADRDSGGVGGGGGGGGGEGGGGGGGEQAARPVGAQIGSADGSAESPVVPASEIRLPARCLASPAAWLARHGRFAVEQARRESPPVFVVDVLGHFVSAVPVWVKPSVLRAGLSGEKVEGGSKRATAAASGVGGRSEEERGAGQFERAVPAIADSKGGPAEEGEDLVPVLLEVNSSAGHYQRHPSLELLFRMLFAGQHEPLGPTEAEAGDASAGTPSGVKRDVPGEGDSFAAKEYPLFLWESQKPAAAAPADGGGLAPPVLGPRKSSSGGVGALSPGIVPAAMLRDWGIAAPPGGEAGVEEESGPLGFARVDDLSAAEQAALEQALRLSLMDS